MAPSVDAGLAYSQSIPAADSSFKEAIKVAGIFPKFGADPSARSWGRDASGVTFASQDNLPKQPLPLLESSCKRYLEALKSLQSAAEQEASTKAVQKFVEGEGPILQKQLQAYNDIVANYFEHFCYEAFLGDNSSVVLNSNAFCAFKPDPNPARNDQIARASSLVRSALEFSQAIREDRLTPDTVRGIPQCMNQYWWLFGVSRIPEDDGGRIRLDADSRHIMVMCRGHIYILKVFKDDSNTIVNEGDLSENLQYIVNDAIKSSNPRNTIGLLTTENQKVWSHCRKLLVHEGMRNGQNLSAIDSSLFTLCLDDSSPKTDSEICRNMICGTNVVRDGVQIGTCLNRWYDKLAIIVTENGAAGMNFEHTCTDGSVDIRMACDMFSGSISQGKYAPATEAQRPLENGSLHSNASRSRWQKLEWDIPADVEDALHTAETHLITRIEQHQLETLDFKDYGSSYIKSAGFSPDAFFQMTLQAAYYSTYRQIRSGFEPVVTRQFLHGRTDVVRTTTPEAAAFARTYGEESTSTAEKIEALRRATEAHVTLSKSCAKGNSHHRHLYVLQQLWKRRRAFMEANELGPQRTAGKGDGLEKERIDNVIFTDPGWSKLGTTILMGSNVDNPHLAYAGFGPAADDGFTVCYYIRADHMAMSVTSRNGEAKRFAHAIEETFRQLRKMLEP